MMSSMTDSPAKINQIEKNMVIKKIKKNLKQNKMNRKSILKNQIKNKIKKEQTIHDMEQEWKNARYGPQNYSA